MPPELANHGRNVQRRIRVEPPELSQNAAKLVRQRQQRREESGEYDDADKAERLSNLPGAKAQKLGKWDERKANAEILADIFRRGGRRDLFKRVATCAPFVCMSQGENGKWRSETMTCDLRECPICSAREAAMRARKLAKAISVVQARHPKMRWLFLTLTQKNSPIGELRETITAMNAAWQRLSQRKVFAGQVIGWARSVEVTRGDNGSAHPHLHVVVGVPTTYFKSGYINHATWRQLWRECARLEYDPVVDVRAIRKAKKDSLVGAVTEVTKASGYSVKPTDAVSDPSWMCKLHEQQQGLRYFAAGGEIKDALKEVEASEADAEGDAEEDEDAAEIVRKFLFTWRPSKTEYRRKRHG